MKKSIVAILLFSISGCSAGEQSENQSLVVNLTESTQIIRELVSQNKLGDLLEEHDQAQLNILIDNVSPAQMAFESEVLATSVPLTVVCFFRGDAQEQSLINLLQPLAQKYDNKVKFVIADADKLFSLALAAEVAQTPCAVFVKNRQIIARIDGDASCESIEQKIQSVTA